MLLLAGCVHLHPGATEREVDGSYDHAVRATLEMLEARPFPIETIDREEGRIVTGKRPVRVIETRRRVEKVRARIQKDDGEVSVRLFLTFMDQSGTVQQPASDREREKAETAADKVFSSSAIYEEYLDAIARRVEELRAATEEV